MAKYRKKPIEIEAIQYTKHNLKEVLLFIGMIDNIDYIPECAETERRWQDFVSDCLHDGIDIKTLEGTMTAKFGDYIIKGINGEFYPCKPDIFDKTYDKVEQDN